MNWRDYLSAKDKKTVKDYEAAKAEYERLHPLRLKAKARAYSAMRYAQSKKQ
jgi:CHAD domain-containing protein